jgi:Mrp family chromosome partitioning ATPase
MNLMSENCTRDCSSCGSECAERRNPKSDFIEKPHELSNIKKVIGIVSGKGGVGKSLVTSLLAVLSSREGYATAILDADITGPSIPKLFGLHDKVYGNESCFYPIKTKTGISVMSLNLLTERETDPVVWRGPIIGGMVKQFWTDVVWGDIDYMFIDMPPGTGDVPLTVFQSIPVDGIIIVMSPQELVGMIAEKALNMARIMNIPVLGLVENMSYFVCPDCGKQYNIFGESKIEEISKRFSIENKARIPIDPRLSAASDKGMIELFEGGWLDDMMNMLERKVN